jgi:hypothetical protein
MKTAKKLRQAMLFISVILFSLNGTPACAEDAAPVVIPSSSPPPTEGLLEYKTSAKQKDETYQYLNKRDVPNPSMNKEAADYISGQSRAQQMIGMLQNQEMTKALEKITGSSKKTLDENPEIRNPLGVIAGAASLWYGRTLKLIKGDDFNFSARMEARNQRSEFNMGSPLLNGKLRFDGKDGMGVGFNRRITDIQTEAGVQYNVRNQVISTEVRQKLAPHLDLSFGASRIDQNTKIEYRLNF